MIKRSLLRLDSVCQLARHFSAMQFLSHSRRKRAARGLTARELFLPGAQPGTKHARSRLQVGNVLKRQV